MINNPAYDNTKQNTVVKRFIAQTFGCRSSIALAVYRTAKWPGKIFFLQFKTSLCGKMLKTQLGVFVILAVFLMCSCVVDSRAATDEQLEGKVTRKRKGRTSTIIKMSCGHNSIKIPHCCSNKIGKICNHYITFQSVIKL